MRRKSVNKAKAAKRFNRQAKTTKAANVQRPAPGGDIMRGGWRL